MDRGQVFILHKKVSSVKNEDLTPKLFDPQAFAVLSSNISLEWTQPTAAPLSSALGMIE